VQKVASIWFGVPQFGQNFGCPETIDMLVTSADCIWGGLILKKAIARSNHAISCTNPPGIATTVNAFIDTEPE
jgi:hypothetical protein